MPKAVVHLQHDIPVTCEAFARHVLGLTEDDVVLGRALFHAYGLGAGVTFPFWAGATGSYSPGRPTPQRILAASQRHRPTLLFLVPTLYNTILNDPAAAGDDLSVVPALPLRRRAARAGDLAALAGALRPGRSSTGSARPSCCTSSAPTRRRAATGLERQAGAGLRAAAARRATASRCRQARWATSSCGATAPRPATGGSTRRASGRCRGSGSPPATATAWTRTASTGTRGAPTT